MLTLYRRGEVYWLRGTVAGRRLHRSARTSDRAIAEQVRAQTEAREWQRHLYGAASVLTFAQAASLYLDARKSSRFLAPIVAYWKDTPVRDVTPGAIKQSAVALYPSAGPATRNRQVITPTQAVINHAAEAGLCPAVRVKRFEVQRTIRPVSDLAWIEAFTGAASPQLAALAWFMFLTGSRITAAIRLTWADIDLPRGEVVIRKPKGQDDARSHLPAILVAAIANIPGERRGKVFGYASRHSVYGAWKRACNRAGLAYIPPHAAGRHGFATGLLRQNVDPVTVAKLGHWASPRQVLDTYGHAIEDRTLTDRLTRNGGTLWPKSR